MSARKEQVALAGKAPGPRVSSPTVMIPEGGPPRPLDIQAQDGAAMERPNTAKRFAAPLLALIERVRGARTAPGGSGKIIPK